MHLSIHGSGNLIQIYFSFDKYDRIYNEYFQSSNMVHKISGTHIV